MADTFGYIVISPCFSHRVDIQAKRTHAPSACFGVLRCVRVDRVRICAPLWGRHPPHRALPGRLAHTDHLTNFCLAVGFSLTNLRTCL